MDELDAYEERFRRAGLPMLVEGSTAREDVWTRAAGPLWLVFVVELLFAGDLSYGVAANAAVVAGALGAGLLVLVVLNARRGRPRLSRPQDVGAWELAAFVLVPALVRLVEGQWESALVTAFANLVFLGVLYLVVAYGLLPIVVWSGRRLTDQLAAAVELLARAIPLLFIFSVVLLFTTEMWQVFARMDDGRLIGTVALLVVLGSVFLVVRLPREVAALEHEVAGVAPLRTRQRLNVALVLFVSQALQVLVVAAAIGVFFVAFGSLVIDDGVVEAWLGAPPDEVRVLGLALDAELLRVATALGALSGVYYAIAVLTDGTYREEFLHELTDELRGTFTARAEYLALRSTGGPPAP